MQGIFDGESPFRYAHCDANCFGIGIGATHTGCHINPDAHLRVVGLFEKYTSISHSDRTLKEPTGTKASKGARLNGERSHGLRNCTWKATFPRNVVRVAKMRGG